MPIPDLPCPGMVRISEEEERVQHVQIVQQPILSLNEIKHGIENITQIIEVLNPFNKQAAIDVLQKHTDCLWHQLGSDEMDTLTWSFSVTFVTRSSLGINVFLTDRHTQ